MKILKLASKKPFILLPYVPSILFQMHSIFISLALFATGRIICWGGSTKGETGRDSLVSIGSLGTVSLLDSIRFSDTLMAIQMSSGYYHSCAVFANRRVRCWGWNEDQALGDGTTIDKGTNNGLGSIAESKFVTFAPSVNVVPIVAVSVGG